jgi:hypothetical protein
VAATPLQALADLYTGITTPAALPKLYVGKLEVPANRPYPPYSLLLQTARDALTQAAATTGGTTGLVNETVWASFLTWTFDPTEADAVIVALLDVLTPKAAAVTGAKTFLRVMTSGVGEERHKEERARQHPNPLGDVKYVDRLYRAAVGVMLRADYT